jgi:hypothetical protein
MTYIAGKSDVLRDVLALSDLSEEQSAAIHRLNTRLDPGA